MVQQQRHLDGVGMVPIDAGALGLGEIALLAIIGVLRQRGDLRAANSLRDGARDGRLASAGSPCDAHHQRPVPKDPAPSILASGTLHGVAFHADSAARTAGHTSRRIAAKAARSAGTPTVTRTRRSSGGAPGMRTKTSRSPRAPRRARPSQRAPLSNPPNFPAPAIEPS